MAQNEQILVHEDSGVALRERFLTLMEIDEVTYKADITLLDRYQAYSAELLRLSPAGLGAVGFFLANNMAGSQMVKLSLAISVITFGISAGGALAHRFHSSDGIFHHMRAVRLSRLSEPPAAEIEKQTKMMKNIYAKSWTYLRVSCIALGIGALAAAAGAIAAIIVR